MKKFIALLALLLFAVLVRIALYRAAPQYLATADTASYYATARKIVTTRVLADPWRTPGYPVFLALPFIFEGKPLPDTYYGYFTPEFVALRVVQSAAGVLTVMLFYAVLLNIGLKRKPAWIFGFLVACNWSVLLYENILLTETLSLLWLVTTMFLMVSALRRWLLGKGIALGVLFAIGVLLRPSIIFLPVLFASLLAWYWRKRIVVVWAVSTLVLYAGVLITYSRMNAQYFSYSGISRISDVNVLGKILQYRLSVQQVQGGEIKDIVAPYISDHQTDPWIIYAKNPQLYDAKYAAPTHQFVTDVIRHNIGLYILRSAQDIPVAMLTSGDIEYTLVARPFLNNFFGFLTYINRYLRMGYVLLFVALPVYLYRAWKKKSLYNVSLALFSFVGLYYVTTAVFLSYNDYGRLMLPAVPFLFVVSYWWCYQVVRGIIIWVKRL